MNILVTGGAGYIGSHTCQELSQAGHLPIVFDNLSTGHKEAVQWGPLVIGDLHNKQLLIETFKKFQIDAVMHFAAFALVGESTQEPLKYYQNNTLGTLSLLESMQAAKVTRLIFSSTCATYGNPEHIPISENHPQNPINPYGTSKLFSEQMMQEFCRAHGFSIVALRYFNAAGADASTRIGELHNPETHLIPLAIKAALDPQFTLSLYGNDYATPDGTCIRDYIHVKDLAMAHVAALQNFVRGQLSPFNLGTGQGDSVQAVIQAVENICQKKVKLHICPRRAGDPPTLIANPQKALESLNWKPQHSNLFQIVQSAFLWYQHTQSRNFTWQKTQL